MQDTYEQLIERSPQHVGVGKTKTLADKNPC